MPLSGQPMLALQNAISAAGVALLNSANMRLYVNTPPLTINDALAAYTEPTFAGYAAAAIGTATLSTNANTDVIAKYGSQTFATSSVPVTPVSVNGYFLEKTISSVDTLLFAEQFAAPIVFSLFPQAYEISFEWIIPNIRNYGGYCSIC